MHTYALSVHLLGCVMPTSKPRVQVTLEPETHEVIDRFAKLQGRTRGSVISEFLDSVRPSLARSVALLEAALESPEDIKQGLRGLIDQLQGELTGVTGDASAQIDMMLNQLDSDADSEGSNPHVVTRGSGSKSPPSQKAPKPRKSRGSSK